MLEIGMNGIIKNFGFKNVLDGVNLEIMTGDRIALIGRNGTGKSTILKLIAGEEKPNQGMITIRRGATVGYLEQIPQLMESDTTTREVLLAPFDELFAVERRLRALETAMSEATDADTLDRTMRSYAYQQSLFESLDGYAIEERLGRIITGFGLTDLVDRPFNVLSGGQKTVVMLACTILRQPDILLLDEPTNHLDIRTLEWFEAYLAKYSGTVLIVSHDRFFLDKVAQKTLLLDGGECTLFHGNYTFSQKEQERLLLLEFEQYKSQQKKIEQMKAAIARFRDWADRGNNERLYKKAKQLELRLEKMEMLDRPQLEKSKVPIQFSGERTGRETLRLKDIALNIGDLTLIDRASVTLFYREKACLVGDNGTGKTTLLRAILGEIPFTAGEWILAPNANVGYIPQEIRFADDSQSVLEVFRSEHPCAEGIARGILAQYFFFGDQVNKRVSVLSGGEKVLLKLSILMQRQINLLVLDEPTNHIDVETREILEEALLDFTGTILFVSHDRYFIQRIANCIFALENRSIRTIRGDYAAYRAACQRL